MLMTEWNWDDALAVRYEEGMERGMEKGREEGTLEVARKMKAAGRPLSEITEFTGLSSQVLAKINKGL